jgi:hypothetical protein
MPRQAANTSIKQATSMEKAVVHLSTLNNSTRIRIPSRQNQKRPPIQNGAGVFQVSTHL